MSCEDRVATAAATAAAQQGAAPKKSVQSWSAAAAPASSVGCKATRRRRDERDPAASGHTTKLKTRPVEGPHGAPSGAAPATIPMT
eukprot:10419413-Alexandrium_andersonii.AAC.1